MTSSRQETIKQHYVPKFYLKQWAGLDGELCITTRRGERLIESRRKPEYTAYEDRLYSFRDEPLCPNPEPDVIETKVLSIIDNSGAKAHRRLLSEGPGALTDAERRAWALFLNSMFERDPLHIRNNEAIATQIAEQVINEVENKATSEEARERIRRATKLIDASAAAANLVRRYMISEIRNDYVLQYLEDMRWIVLTVPPEIELHTSNRPLVVNAGKRRTPIEFAWMPLSPSTQFVLFPKSVCLDEGTDSRREAESILETVVKNHNFLLLQERPERLYTRQPLSPNERRAALELLTPIDG